MNDEKRKEAVDWLMARLHSLRDWYSLGAAVDCEETRKNLRRDLDDLLGEFLKKFKLVSTTPIQFRIDKDGIVTFYWPKELPS